ncbi:hypothetical protein P171DRAFT_177349 [Karstenula rhodostoma CBS 690.94]|uniref:Uncharacterized protein n=1 Tax=Karstenula rhodostoma CBS 690.94 TaxID=1392251 RepID=A0A9P4U5Q9_9PLEO|nr:hypothetical protein P171DRAFT_177349 [Karstenula rhodostoma CBS 690.94]
MKKLLITLHLLNVLVGSLCITILGLTTRSVVVKDKVDSLIPSRTRSTGMGMLMWAGCGGIVDMLLLLCLISAKAFRRNELVTVSTFYWNCVLFVATFIFLRPLIILSYTHSEHTNYFTPERWGCEVGTGSDARSLCHNLRAARVLLIPAFILSTGLPTFALWMRLETRRLATDDRVAEEAQSNQQKNTIREGNWA